MCWRRCLSAPAFTLIRVRRQATPRKDEGPLWPLWQASCALTDRRRSRTTLQLTVLLEVKAANMDKPVVIPAPVAKTLAEQKSDFTAEGSPPPGKVSTSTPVGPPHSKMATPTQRPVRGTITLKQLVARSNP